jgi:hypothetical protein
VSSNVKFLLPQTNRGRVHPPNFDNPVLINGDGGYTSPPAIVQDAAFPMTNALSPGRNGLVWRCPPGQTNFSDGTSVVLEVDTLSNISPLAWGILGFRGPTSQPTRVELWYNAQATYNSGVTNWVQATPNITLGQDGVGSRSDRGTLISPPAARYWRFKFISAFGSTQGFQCSGFFLQTAITDIGFLYSGADETRIIPRTVVEAYNRAPTITKVGPEFRRWSLRYDNNDAALRTTFDSLFSYQAQQEPFIFLTPDGEFYECVWDDESFTRSHIWAPPDRYQFTVGLRSLT